MELFPWEWPVLLSQYTYNRIYYQQFTSVAVSYEVVFLIGENRKPYHWRNFSEIMALYIDRKLRHSRVFLCPVLQSEEWLSWTCKTWSYFWSNLWTLQLVMMCLLIKSVFHIFFFMYSMWLNFKREGIPTFCKLLRLLLDL